MGCQLQFLPTVTSLLDGPSKRIRANAENSKVICEALRWSQDKFFILLAL